MIPELRARGHGYYLHGAQILFTRDSWLQLARVILDCFNEQHPAVTVAPVAPPAPVPCADCAAREEFFQHFGDTYARPTARQADEAEQIRLSLMTGLGAKRG